MTSQVPEFETLTQHIIGLQPEELNGELRPMLDYEERGAMARLVRVGDVPPVLEMLDVIEGSVAGLEDERSREILLDGMVRAVGFGIRARDDAMGIAELTERASHLADGIESSGAKANALTWMAQSIVETETGQQEVSLMAQGSSYLEQSAAALFESAASKKSRHFFGFDTIARVAEVSATNATYLGLAEQPNSANQPLMIYEKAFELANSIPATYDRLDRKEMLAVSVTEAILDVAAIDTNTELEEALVHMMQVQVDEIIATYEDFGGESRPDPIRKAYSLAEFGANLVETIGQKSSEDVASYSQKQLIEQAVKVFEAANTYTAKVGALVKSPASPVKGAGLMGPFYATKSADQLIKVDLEAGLRLFEIAYDMAIAANNALEFELIRSIHGHAFIQPTAEEAFRIYLFAQGLEEKHATGTDDVADSSSVHQFIHYLDRSNLDIPEDTNFDKIDRPFAEKAVAMSARYSTERSNRGFQRLQDHVGDPKLKQVIEDSLEALADKRRKIEQRRPASKALALAQELL
ncbi:MAG: hypothetical protein AAB436_04150 [Patescibacteria group bacterium]